ncbi:hypothetical protein [Paenibacillus sp. Leaf72]|uniref:hypothetical protein n=1 Tax=Paenibacillus sp. Leaf72 TaxID=1736234 RepID=UPI0006F5F4E0|nr:hypothetical protein [Paenibacillus sp. Leaf72]KQN97021.1 hypothetical protein ASF12_23415 [Paenibacillus sp. Leaf72]
MIGYILAVLAVLLLYWSFSTMLEKEKKYRSQAYVTGSNKVLWKQMADTLEVIAKNRVKLSETKRRNLESMLYRVGWEETPEDVAAQQLLFGGLSLVGLTLFAIFIESLPFFFIALVVGFVFYLYPMSRLKKAVAYKEEQAKLQLPDFIDLLILLFSAGLTPYNAIKKASEQAPLGLRLDCERLSNDLDAMSESHALDRFAKNVGIPAAKRFCFAMKQAIQMDKSEAQEIFMLQSSLMRSMRIQNQRKVIKERPGRLQLISTGVFVFVMLVPILIIGLNFIKSMNFG